MDSNRAVTWIAISMAFFIVLAYTSTAYTHSAYNTNYAIGNEVKTTEEYTDAFGDMFSGRITYHSSVWERDRAIIVQNADGTKRVFVPRWLEHEKTI